MGNMVIKLMREIKMETREYENILLPKNNDPK